jgi:hypothetical protein
MMSEANPGLTGCRKYNSPIAIRKHILQMNAARLSILNRAIVQKSTFLVKIALFCLIN